MIKFNGYPLLENHDHAYGVPGESSRMDTYVGSTSVADIPAAVSTVMRKDMLYLPSRGMKLDALREAHVKPRRKSRIPC